MSLYPGPRTPLVQRLGLRANYEWRNSGNRALTGIHHRWDLRPGAQLAPVLSTAGGLTIAYAGLPDGLRHTLEFTESQRAPTNVPVRRTSGTADLEIIATSAEQARAFPLDNALIAPMRVHLVVDTDRPREDVRQTTSRRERWQHSRNQRNHGWTWTVETAPSAFDEFYDNMYLPTMRARHGNRQRLEEKDVAYECIFRRGFLFSLSEGDRRIAGTLCHWNPRTRVVTLRLLGVERGRSAHYDTGAFKAVYHHLLAWACRNGIRQVDFQGTEPFLSKGTFQWKRRLGSRVVLPPNHFGRKRLWIHALRDTPPVRDFLVANPVLTDVANSNFEAVYFHDDRRPARLDLAGTAPGISELRTVKLDQFLAGLPS
jgi:hypothetical protein